eukprot:TRINITY_DN44023_c0_g1_i1.p1 TRINITY_DN44023_c0_g1~~TRINITY_DN44023_c0_g1_i1.p1  ORF type:complete len:316 (-),score=38.48 TRINITY_DN44023_c0_g1_i1:48-995(-)
MLSSAGPGSPEKRGSFSKQSRGSLWQRDQDVDQCPICETAFTATIRRHHCRQCGRVVCDECSRHRLRLPNDANAGKARVCNDCATQLMEFKGTDFEEDLDVSTQIVGELRNNLAHRFAETEVCKRILLDLEIDATGNKSLLEKYCQDSQNDAYSFCSLLDLANQRWAEMRLEIHGQPERGKALVEEHQAARSRCSAAANAERNLIDLRRSLVKELDEMAKAESERKELQEKEVRLRDAHVATRARIRELERERRVYQDQEARGSRQTSFVESDHGDMPYTITAGREDPLLGNTAHHERRFLQCVESCRHGTCALM